MKKLFTLTVLLLLMTMGANAQEKKTWDFTKGLSAETIANLNADTGNWSPNGTDADGVTNNWQNAVKPSATEELKANGEVIAETAGLLFNIGNNKANSIHLATTKIRLTRASTTITFPQLQNGQKVTIVGRSANSKATDRGIAPVQDYIVLTDGVTTDGKCIFLGNEAEGSLGTYSFTWEVQTSESGPVDVQFKLTPNAGIDFTLFMIDEGDEITATKVAYLYDGTADNVLAYLQSNELYSVTPINVTSTTVTAEELQQYDVTVVGASVPAAGAAAQTVKEALPWTPTLNLNAQLYPVWAYGEAVAAGMMANVKNSKDALFNGLVADVDIITSDGITGAPLTQGSPLTGVKLGEYFEGDAIPAVDMGDESVALIHTHNINHNGYVYFPYAADYSDGALKILANALDVLTRSKREITPAMAPTITREYKDMHTLVTIAAPNLPKTKIYYTTDGSEPTTSSTEYTEVIDIHDACTLKAAAIAEGYTLSPSAELYIDIKQQPATPTISYEQLQGKTIVTLSGSYGDDVVVWYNFEGLTDTVKSARYAEPFTITMPQNITAFAVAGEAVWSELAQERVLVKNPRVVIDVAGHFRAAKWDDVANGGGVFSNGKSAISMYDTTQEGTTTVDPETGDEITVYPEVEWMVRDEAGDDPQWQIMTKGQSVLWQNLGASTDKVGINEGGYYPSASEDIDELFPITSNDIQFYNIFAGERANAAIQSKQKYQAPLDIVVLCNMQGGPIVAQVSADGEEWTTVGDEIEKTGYSRMWKKYTRMYEGTDEVYVRVAQQSGTFGPKIFDIYVANQGEKSQELLAELRAELGEEDGIGSVQQSQTRTAAVYSLSGVRQNGMQRGVNIVVGSNGRVSKVLVK